MSTFQLYKEKEAERRKRKAQTGIFVWKIFTHTSNNGNIWIISSNCPVETKEINEGVVKMSTAVTKMKELEKFWGDRISEMSEERKRIKGGYITVREINERFYYQEKKGKKTKAVTKNPKRRDELIRAKYLDLKIKELKACRDALRKAIKKARKSKVDPEKALRTRFKDPAVDVERLFWTAKQLECIGKQSENPYRREDLKILTSKGIWVRSLSEQLIANLYEELCIPYQYEKATLIDITDIGDRAYAEERGGRLYKTFYPDFTIIFADGSTIIHEHFGLLSDEEYRAAAGKKVIELLLCEDTGLRRIIVTGENDAKNLSRLRNILKESVLPYVYA